MQTDFIHSASSADILKNNTRVRDRLVNFGGRPFHHTRLRERY
jgi:hypothetical protein